jgi:hypothetical protein
MLTLTCTKPQFRGLGEQDLERSNVKIMPQNDASKDGIITNAVDVIKNQM